MAHFPPLRTLSFFARYHAARCPGGQAVFWYYVLEWKALMFTRIISSLLDIYTDQRMLFCILVTFTNSFNILSPPVGGEKSLRWECKVTDIHCMKHKTRSIFSSQHNKGNSKYVYCVIQLCPIYKQLLQSLLFILQ